MGRPADMTIGALALATQSSVQTIRFYEKIGLLPAPPRTRSGRRVYDDIHKRRLNIVRRYRRFGFSIPEVRTLLDLLDRDVRTCSDARTIAEEQRAELRLRIAQAQRLEGELSDFIAGCRKACPDGGSAQVTLQEVLAGLDSRPQMS
jgi:MerR family mercuric resistance operon transcriptional regulator